jgi:hypothetical protein
MRDARRLEFRGVAAEDREDAVSVHFKESLAHVVGVVDASGTL